MRRGRDKIGQGQVGDQPRHAGVDGIIGIFRPFYRRLASSILSDEQEQPMSLTIRYRDPHQPNQPDMVMIAEQEKAARIVDQLEERGFVVDKITFIGKSDQGNVFL